MRFIILFGLLALCLLIFLGRFGFAESFANYFVLLSAVFVLLQIFNVKKNYSVAAQRISFDKFHFLGWIGIALAVFLVFRPIFSTGPAVWGDAPYFYHGTFKDFFSEPLSWESRGRLGIVNDLYWLYPLMFIYYALGVLTGLGNDVIIRLIFYFPAIFFASFSSWLFARYLGFSSIVGVFAALVYSLNTYFILLIDGGQVGVALAYGLFPFALLQLYKLKSRKTLQFFVSLASFMLLVIADVRFALITIFTLILWQSLEQITPLKKINFKNWKIFIIFGIAVLAVSSYWLVPAFTLKPTTGAGSRSDLQLISILHPLFVFAPHWPENQFGMISPPSLLFVALPLLVFANLFFKRSRRISVFIFCFLFFVFLAKGDTGLFGSLYSWILDTIPFGGAFRDSTKFLAPLALFAGILIAVAIQNIQSRFKKYMFSKVIVIFAYFYLLFLAYPAIFGNMNGVLAGRDFSKDIKIIADKIFGEADFLRTIWFPERHPLAVSSERKPALDAKTLVGLRPFASLNTGTIDVFNFLHNSEFVEWLKLLGIKYLVFPGNVRNFDLNKEKQEDWNNLLSLVGSRKELTGVEWNTNIPVYDVGEVKPRIFAVEKLIAVVGSDDIYQKIKDVNANFSIGNQAFVFFEDGKFIPNLLADVDADSTILLLNDKTDLDLTMSFLQNHFISPFTATKGIDGPSQWALRSSNDYLKWKYEFLVNNVDTKEFDYGKGIAFSSVANEWIYFDVPVQEDGEYVFAARVLTRNQNEPLEVNLYYGKIIPFVQEGKFEWYVQEGINLKKGKKRIAFRNIAGFHGLNTLALIRKKDWEEAQAQAKNLIKRFSVIRLDGKGDKSELLKIIQDGWSKVDYEFISPSRYTVQSKYGAWLVFTDSYNPGWKLKRGDKLFDSFPFYSAINGFYLDSYSNSNKLIIEFEGQKYTRIGLILSLISVLLLALGAIWAYSKKVQSI